MLKEIHDELMNRDVAINTKYIIKVEPHERKGFYCVYFQDITNKVFNGKFSEAEIKLYIIGFNDYANLFKYDNNNDK